MHKTLNLCSRSIFYSSNPRIFLTSLVVLLLFMCFSGTPAWCAGYTVSTVTISTKAKSYDVDIKYPKISGLADKKAEQAFNSYVKTFMDGRIASLKSKIKEFNPGPGEHWTLGWNYTVKYRSDYLISVDMNGYTNSGGPYPNNDRRAFTFDLAKGRLLEIGDLFDPYSTYLSRLSQICTSALKKMGIPLGQEYKEAVAPKKENFRNFLVTKNALVIVFVPYQVGPHAVGSPEVPIVYHRLQDIINYRGPLRSIVGK